ncbi:MAG: DUF2752 domain-containing protein [Defluviitaleaceae bacterium]|nr:DUF2752 domain-containing protein [Defluviitaleaceae bacterium]
MLKDNNVRNTFFALAFVGILTFLSSLVNISICIFHIITGIPCPACGMGRAYGSLFHLDLVDAFIYHPLFFLVPFIPLLMWDKIPKKISSALNITFLTLFISLWIIRMFIFFPHTAPMEYNSNSLFELIIGLFR